MSGPLIRVGAHVKRMISLPLQLRRERSVVALELGGEWLKLAQVAVGPKGRRLVRLIGRRVASQEELSKMLLELAKEGAIPTESVLISIPRNLVTVRNLQLPTTDLQELKEMVSLQAAKQTPYSKDEIIPDFQVVRSSPEGYTDVVLVTAHRSVSSAWLKILDEAQLKAEGIRLSSYGVLSSYRMSRPSTGDEEKGPIAVVDIDSNFSDFMVILNGEINLTRALSIGSAKLLEGQAREIERFAEEIQRAVDLYESESIGLRITKLVVTGAEIERAGLTIESLTEKLRVPVERVSLLDSIPGAREMVDLPEAQRGALSFAAVLGLGWDPGRARIDLMPQEVRIREALVQKGRALVFMGMLVISILTALTVLIWQPIYFKKQYLEQLQREVRRTQEGASEVESVRKKIKSLKGATRLQNSSLEILYVLHKTLPSEIYLKAVTFEEGSQVTLKGVSRRMSAVFEYVAILEKLPNFRQVKTRHVTKSEDKGGNEEADFEITCPLRLRNEV